jgi:type I restriction enzyme S subunit
VLDTRDVWTISEIDHRTIYTRCPTRKGDIWLTKDGANCGNAAINTFPCEVSLLSSVAVIRPDPDQLDTRYLLEWILSDAGQTAIAGKARGLAITRVTLAMIRDLKVPLPSLPIQQMIGAIGTNTLDVDAKFDALIAAKREQKRGLLQQLLTGKVRFPGFTEPWKTVRIGDVLAIDPEQLPAATPPDYTFKYIDLGSVNDGVVEVPTQPIDFATAPSRARRVLRQGDVLLSTVRPLLRGFGMIEAVDGPLVGSTGFAVLRTTRTEDARFILECLFSENVLRQMHARTTGSSYPALGSEDVRSLVIPWPSQSERSRIGAVLTAATKEIRTLAEARGLLATQRRGLMERLLSGEIDIPSSDTSAA